jgi:molybdopterin/thiamine biosynthesis adenylyltransferase
MVTTTPANFESEFFSRSCLFTKYAVGLGENQNYQSIMSNAEVAITGSQQELARPNGQLMATMVANLLSRFSRHLTLIIPDDIPLLIEPPMAHCTNLVECLASVIKNINPTVQLEIISEGKNGLYDAVLVIGRYKKELGRTIYIASDGWIAYVDTEGNSFGWVSNNSNAIGAYTAACLGAAEIFKITMSKLGRRNLFNTASSGSYIFSALDYGFRVNRLANPVLPRVYFSRPAHLISLGAINSALLYTLRSIPVRCEVSIIEPQMAEISNLNRYLLLTAQDAISGSTKCSVAQKWAQRHIGVEAYAESYEDYRTRLKSPIDIALVGVDNDQTRWKVQEDLPRILLCGGTELSQIRISRHVNPFKEACLGCIYPKRDTPPLTAQTEAVPSISFVSGLAGVLMAGELLKENLEELRPYALDICLDLDILQMPHFRVSKPQKSAKCGCNCQNWR